MEREELQKCCICGKIFRGFGNNSYPLNSNENSKCCNKCNGIYVAVAIMPNGNITDLMQYYKYIENNEEIAYGIK